MAIHFQCVCGRDYSVRAKRAGKTIACPECGASITVPELPHGERRKEERRKRDRRDAQRPTPDALPHGDRRRGHRRRGDRRAPGGLDLTDRARYMDGPPTVVDNPPAHKTHTPADATPLPIRLPKSDPPRAAGPPKGTPVIPPSWYPWLKLTEWVLGATLLAILVYAITWLFFL